MAKILLCEDEPKLSRILATALESAGYEVEYTRVDTAGAMQAAQLAQWLASIG